VSLLAQQLTHQFINKSPKRHIFVKKIFFFVALTLLVLSCNTNKQIVYVQDAGKQILYTDSSNSAIPDVTLKVGDLLTITVNTTTPEASIPFNLPVIPSQNSFNISSVTTVASSLQNYLVDTRGDIMFPVIGRIHVAGMKKTDLNDYIKAQIYPHYIKEEPIILIRDANFKISILGEVNRPGVCPIDNEKVSIFDAIALAGDLTIYGRRDNVLLIRESNGKRVSVRIDLRDKRLIDSPYYFLQQNDILYIQPNNPKSNSSNLGSLETFAISIVGTLISLTTFVITVLKK